ncbi:IclR family transcriptional regulator [Micromonospora sp. NPDC047074]|uniref:IclR family transcriptional regulator n=1 Tax=Micromonospora sp. NPDC047074 TaxID=3154339 RepID=UPI00340A3AFF
MGVVALIADQAPQTLGVSAVARSLNLPKAVAHRILKELVSAGLLSFDDDSKQYRLGPGALTVGLAALRSLDVPTVARPYLENLVRETGETATLSMRQGWTRVYIAQVISPHEVHMQVSLGTRHPLHAGSSSKAILAAMAPDEVAAYLERQQLEELTSSTITSAARLLDDLRRVRRRGYAVSLGERQRGAGSVAAAIHGSDGNAWGSVSLCGPRDRFEAGVCEAHGELLVAAAERISEQIGYRKTPAEEEPMVSSAL